MTQTKWLIDPTHSEISFKVKHLMITTVTGNFRDFEGYALIEGEDFSAAQIGFTAQTASIFTNNEQRDAHLKSPDFFDADNHPQLVFTNGQLEHKDGHFELVGDLSIKGLSQRVSLAVEFLGLATDPWGNQKAGFSIEGKIKRSDWGLNWNAALETGGVLVSDEVKIFADIQLVKQA